jgi:hypothetical protein
MNRAERAKALKQASISYAERCHFLALEVFPNLGPTEMSGMCGERNADIEGTRPRERCERVSRGSSTQLQGSV